MQYTKTNRATTSGYLKFLLSPNPKIKFTKGKDANSHIYCSIHSNHHIFDNFAWGCQMVVIFKLLPIH